MRKLLRYFIPWWSSYTFNIVIFVWVNIWLSNVSVLFVSDEFLINSGNVHEKGGYNVLIQQVNLHVKNTIITLNCSGFISYNFQMFGTLNWRRKEPPFLFPIVKDDLCLSKWVLKITLSGSFLRQFNVPNIWKL
jgi:hypothetical protein